MNKIYIMGPIGSGKSTLAKKISEMYGHAYGELDYVVYKYDNDKRKSILASERERTEKLNNITKNKKWVIEDNGNILFSPVYPSVDLFVILEPRLIVRQYRIIKRFTKKFFKLEKYGFDKNLNFKDKIKFQLSLLKATNNYNNKNFPNNKLEIRERIKEYQNKVCILKTNKDIKKFLNNDLN